MKIRHIEYEKEVRKTKEEYQNELKDYSDDIGRLFVSKYKMVPTEEPTYIVEMSQKEFQLVSFYLELENRKPIMNVKVDAEIKKERKNEK